MTSPRSLSCPRCDAGPLAPCEPVDGDIEPGMTHLARSEAWAAAQPRPEHKPTTMYDETPEPLPVPSRTDARQMKIGG